MCRVQKGLHTVFSHKIRLDQSEFLAVANCEREEVSVMLSLCFEDISANWVCSACAGLAFGFEHKEHGLIFISSSEKNVRWETALPAENSS